MRTMAAIAVHSSAIRSALTLAGWLALSFTAAAMGGFFLPAEWYASLRKPAWNPPNWIFGPVWNVLYATMGITAWLVWKRGGIAGQRIALSLFLLQLLFNALWSPLFFGLRNPGLALPPTQRLSRRWSCPYRPRWIWNCGGRRAFPD
jgi:tryptophan-rich sensory protein